MTDNNGLMHTFGDDGRNIFGMTREDVSRQEQEPDVVDDLMNWFTHGNYKQDGQADSK
jgi:hypothetical protein